ncbi:MAG: hypothetical protein QW035_02510 [Candidatus Anstonellales archaeon]
MDSYENMLNHLYSELSKVKKVMDDERFEMPIADITVQGQTSIFRNFQAVADKFRRSPAFFSAFLAKELGAPVEASGDKLIIKTKVKPDMLNKKLLLFFDRFVKCSQCNRPDTVMEIDPVSKAKVLRCESCGAKTTAK